MWPDETPCNYILSFFFRPPVAGIAGKPVDGAYSIVLAGGYEDDEDFGDEFTYTGAGGRDLSGNKRTSEQAFDQELTKTNLAIAVNCDCPVNKGTFTYDVHKVLDHLSPCYCHDHATYQYYCLLFGQPPPQYRRHM